MRWVLSDGTTIELGGVVAGSSELAERLRRDVAAVAAGRAPRLPLRPPPGHTSLDVEDVAAVDTWVRLAAGPFDVTVVSAPELEHGPVGGEPDEPDVEGKYPIY